MNANKKRLWRGWRRHYVGVLIGLPTLSCPEIRYYINRRISPNATTRLIEIRCRVRGRIDHSEKRLAERPERSQQQAEYRPHGRVGPGDGALQRAQDGE